MSEENLRISGAEYKAFMADDTSWPDGVYHDDVLIYVDSVAFGDEKDLIVENIPDTAEIRIESGDVFSKDRDLITGLDDHFYDWRNSQQNALIVVSVPRSNIDAVTAAIRAAGGTVK